VITVTEARRYYEGADAVHDFDHVLRVLALAERIGRAEGADLEIVRTAALLHDAGREGAEAQGLDHAAFAAARAREILTGQPREKVEAVAHAVAAHRFRAEPEPVTLEAQVLFDADKLDAIGAVGVARAFAYGGARGQRLWAPTEAVDVARWTAEGDNPGESRDGSSPPAAAPSPRNATPPWSPSSRGSTPRCGGSARESHSMPAHTIAAGNSYRHPLTCATCL
jgi:putative nucleotidyltransferase with HDIG domain